MHLLVKCHGNVAIFYCDKLLHLLKGHLGHMQDRRNSTRERSCSLGCHNIKCGTLHEPYFSLSLFFFCFSLSENEFLLIFWSIHPYLSLYVYLWLCSPLLDLGCFFSFLILYTVGRTPWTGDQPVARPIPTYRTTQTQNKRTQTSMPCVGFQPKIPAFERAKTVHASDRAATVIGYLDSYHEH
jgi:hypothetical protein